MVIQLIFFAFLAVTYGLKSEASSNNAGVEVYMSKLENAMYTTEIQVGTPSQGSDSKILIDLTSTGIYLEVKSRSHNGVYNFKSSKTYNAIGDKKNPITKYVNGWGLLGWDAQDIFGLVSQSD